MPPPTMRSTPPMGNPGSAIDKDIKISQNTMNSVCILMVLTCKTKLGLDNLKYNGQGAKMVSFIKFHHFWPYFKGSTNNNSFLKQEN